MSDSHANLLRQWLARSWWPIFPAFLVIVFALVRERACFDRTYLLPAVSVRPIVATLVATAYVTAHAWLVGAYSLTVMETRQFLPSIGKARQVWGQGWLRLWTMVAVFLLEYTPAAIWARVAGGIWCP